MPRAVRILGRITVRLSLLALLVWGGWWLISAPESPVPMAWNPAAPLDVSADRTWFTGMKLRRALGSDAACLAALGTGATFRALPPVGDARCGIDPRVSVSALGEARLRPVETTCAVALRAAMWERHVLRPAAETLGVGIAEIRHQGSYSCRPIRGGSERMSTHATAEAIDVKGVALTDGRGLDLAAGWDDPGEVGAFWRAARDGACTWFATVLGPDYNALHADHFHMQSRGWGLCR